MKYVAPTAAAVLLATQASAGSLGEVEVAPMIEAPEEVAGSSNGSSVNPLWLILPLAIGAVLLADDDTEEAPAPSAPM